MVKIISSAGFAFIARVLILSSLPWFSITSTSVLASTNLRSVMFEFSTPVRLNERLAVESSSIFSLRLALIVYISSVSDESSWASISKI